MVHEAWIWIKKEKRREKSKRERANLRGDVAFGHAAAIVRRLVVSDESVDAGGSVEYEQQQQQQGQQGKVHHTPHTTQDNTITSIDMFVLIWKSQIPVGFIKLLDKQPWDKNVDY